MLWLNHTWFGWTILKIRDFYSEFIFCVFITIIIMRKKDMKLLCYRNTGIKFHTNVLKSTASSFSSLPVQLKKSQIS